MLKWLPAGLASRIVHALAAVLTLCVSSPMLGQVVDPRSLPGWAQDRIEAVRPALEAQCRLKRPPEPWARLCPELRAAQDVRSWIEAHFEARVLRTAQGGEKGLITGYHEPLLTGSLGRESAAQAPLYRLPDALDPSKGGRPPTGRATAWHTRSEIESGAVRGLEPIVWLDDPVEAFFLQVQGSGRVRLRDGRWLRVAYAGHNGQPYKAIGKVLVDRGDLTREQADAPGIKSWLRQHPERAIEVLQTNPRYVFFRALTLARDTEPAGSLGVPLTPGRSIATDRSHIAPGAMVFVETTEPVSGQALRALMVSQDTGGAIIGAVRADVYWGSGELAEQRAGRMRHPGRLWVLVPKGL
ncbi:MAG: Membrane-bound lytic murein transglycosylase precursor [Pseudomonadota bacterium]